jgi:hypothetical protein
MERVRRQTLNLAAGAVSSELQRQLQWKFDLETMRRELRPDLSRSANLSSLDPFERLSRLKDVLPGLLEAHRLAQERSLANSLNFGVPQHILSSLTLSAMKLDFAGRQQSEIAGALGASYEMQEQFSRIVEQMRAQNTVSLLNPVALQLLVPVSTVTQAATRLYENAETHPGLFAQLNIPQLLPAFSVYTATRAVGSQLVEGDDVEDEVEIVIEDDENQFIATVADLPERLSAVDPAFVRLLRGAEHALANQGPDWARQFSASTRELLALFLEYMAPVERLDEFYADKLPGMSAKERAALHDGSKWTRTARMAYILAPADQGDFKLMAQNVIEISGSLFFPTNTAVHVLSPTLTPLQAQILLHQLEASLKTFLSATGH